MGPDRRRSVVSAVKSEESDVTTWSAAAVADGSPISHMLACACSMGEETAMTLPCLTAMRGLIRSIIVAGGLAGFTGEAVAQEELQCPSGARNVAAAPAPRQIRPGDTFCSMLDASDRSAENRVEEYTLALDAGEVVQIDMESEAFDTYLELWGVDENAPLAFNDDRDSNSVNSRLVFEAPDRGLYRIRAQDYFEGTGPYTLAVRTLPRAPRPRRIGVGQRTDDFDPADPVLASNLSGGRNYRYKLYEFAGREGDRVRIDMRSSNIDPRLELLDDRGNVIAANNDGGRNLNARIVELLPRSGDYVIRALMSSDQRVDNSRFQLELSLARANPVDEPIVLAHGETPGQLNSNSPAVLKEGTKIDYFYNLYTLPVTENEALALTMESSDFIPVLEVGTPLPLLGPGAFAVAASNDGSRRSSRAQLVIRPRATGVLHIRARGEGSDTGDFKLRVEPAAP